MVYEVVKSLPGSSFSDDKKEDSFFDVIIKNKHYPSCYQYNVLIMLAKRLISEENEKQEKYKVWRNRSALDKKLVNRIISD